MTEDFEEEEKDNSYVPTREALVAKIKVLENKIALNKRALNDYLHEIEKYRQFIRTFAKQADDLDAGIPLLEEILKSNQEKLKKLV